MHDQLNMISEIDNTSTHFKSSCINLTGSERRGHFLKISIFQFSASYNTIIHV